MLQVLTKQNWQSAESLLTDMFRLRHRVLYEERGWKEVYSPDGLDRDTTDHAGTAYLIATHPRLSGVAGCLRITPSLLPNLSSESFVTLFDHAGLPHGPDIYDASRIAVDRRTRTLGWPNPITSELLLGWLEAGIAIGVTKYTCVIELQKMHSLVSTGWRLLPLGLPRQTGNCEIVAVSMTPSTAVLERVRAHYGVVQPVISDGEVELLQEFHSEFLRGFNPNTPTHEGNHEHSTLHA